MYRLWEVDISDLTSVFAAVLAGGKGTRLQAVVADRPKPLAQVNGRPFLTYLLRQLHQAHLSKVLLCTGYKAAMVQATFGDHFEGLELHYSEELTPLGTAGALRLCVPFLCSDTVLVMNGDSYCDLDLANFWAWHLEHRAAISLALINLENTDRFGRVETDSQGQVTRFAEKQVGAGAGWINAGIYAISRSVLESLPAGHPLSLEQDVFPDWIGRGLYAFQGAGRFIDIGTPESYQQVQQFFETIDTHD